MDWFLLAPVALCAMAAVLCGVETINAAREGEFTLIGAVLTLACGASTLIALGAMFR